MMETVFSVGSALRLYNDDPRPADKQMRESPETAVKDDGGEMARKELGHEHISCVLQ
jgi:hypothetical protein